MTVALEDSTYVVGQRASLFVCVTNRGASTISFAPEPGSTYGFKFWRIARYGAWFAMHDSRADALAGHGYKVPPISPLEPGGTISGFINLNSYGAAIDYLSHDRLRLVADPTRALFSSRLPLGRYAIHVTYFARQGFDERRMNMSIQSDTLFFRVVAASPEPEETERLSRYAASIDSCRANGLCWNRTAARWLPGFAGSRFFSDVFFTSGLLWPLSGVNILVSVDPNGARLVSDALMLEHIYRSPSLERLRATMIASAPRYPAGSLPSLVLEDWNARPARQAIRDSVYAERRKYLVRGHPPYGTWVEKGDARRSPLGDAQRSGR
ncbi:MAG TPA: hypothetical protein VL503_11345 [Candidatus Omnitrophota bacterium]|nr:hypothetical protein [Candidatus Omnitrophota bacterium]